MKTLREALDEYKIKLADKHNMHPAFDRGFDEAVELLFPLVEAAIEASEYSGRDDVNGNAGELCEEALSDLKAKIGVTNE